VPRVCNPKQLLLGCVVNESHPMNEWMDGWMNVPNICSKKKNFHYSLCVCVCVCVCVFFLFWLIITRFFYFFKREITRTKGKKWGK
jgi:hypothetical protein